MAYWVALQYAELPSLTDRRDKAQKRRAAVFCVKSHFAWRKSATKFLCVKTVSDKAVRHSLAYLSVQKWSVGVPFTV